MSHAEDRAWGSQGGRWHRRVGLAKGRSWDRALAHDRGLKVTHSLQMDLQKGTRMGLELPGYSLVILTF